MDDRHSNEELNYLEENFNKNLNLLWSIEKGVEVGLPFVSVAVVFFFYALFFLSPQRPLLTVP